MGPVWSWIESQPLKMCDYAWSSDFLKAFVPFFLASEAVFWARGRLWVFSSGRARWQVPGAWGWTESAPVGAEGALKDLGTTPVAPQIAGEEGGTGQVSRNPSISLLL